MHSLNFNLDKIHFLVISRCVLSWIIVGMMFIEGEGLFAGLVWQNKKRYKA